MKTAFLDISQDWIYKIVSSLVDDFHHKIIFLEILEDLIYNFFSNHGGWFPPENSIFGRFRRLNL